ncbi:MAG: MMPL family transporter, partial [Deltaproteobacteria bacterium]|nr:MMPL family transporter [Deltaproteobacteria bacterium]
SKERKLALYLLRMKESSNSVTRAESLSRIRKVVRAHGFRIFRMGGIFALQKQMGELLSRSVVVSFLFSLPVFFLCGYILSRSIRVALALLLSAAVSPCILLGVNGVFGLPLDLVTVPAAILVTALGVDEMFHLIHEHRKNDYKGSRWIDDASHLSTPIVHSATILALGFSVLFFSHFPPSVRFGGFLVAGVLLSCASALLILPLMANLLSARRGR